MRELIAGFDESARAKVGRVIQTSPTSARQVM
jgi:hypothetical protein